MGSGGTRATADYGGTYDYGTTNDPFYHKYPMQMFDRKVRVMSELFVGLVATKRLITDELRTRWRDSPDVLPADKEKLGPELDPGVHKVNAFYTYRYVYLSTRALWDYASDLTESTGMTEDGVGWRNESSERHGYHSTGHPADGGVDAFSTMSRTDFQGLVGAWKVGKVFDVAARRREVHSSGPIDTSEALTVNVNIEWYDWRKLRYLAEDPTIGHMNAGALSWGYKMNLDPRRVVYNRANWKENVSDAVFNWPSEYAPANEPYRYDGSSFEARGDTSGQRVATTLARIYNADGAVLEITPDVRATDRVQGFSGTPHAVDNSGKFDDMRQAYESRVKSEKSYRKWLGETGLAVGHLHSRDMPLGETARLTALRRMLKFSHVADPKDVAFVTDKLFDKEPSLSFEVFITMLLRDPANAVTTTTSENKWKNSVLSRLAPGLNDTWNDLYTEWTGINPADGLATPSSNSERARKQIAIVLETLFNDIHLLFRRTNGTLRSIAQIVLTKEEVEFYMKPVNSKGKLLSVEDLLESAGERLATAFGSEDKNRPEAAKARIGGVTGIDPKESNALLMVSSNAPGTSNLGQMHVEPVQGAARPAQGSVAAAVTAAAAVAVAAPAAATPAVDAAAGVGLAFNVEPSAAAAGHAPATATDASAAAPAPAKRMRRTVGAAQGSADVFANIFGGSGGTSSASGTAAATGASTAAATGGGAGDSEPASPAVSDQGSATGASATGAASKSQRSVRRRGQGL